MIGRKLYSECVELFETKLDGEILENEISSTKFRWRRSTIQRAERRLLDTHACIVVASCLPIRHAPTRLSVRE